MAESRRTATRVTRGAICLSSSSHFPLIPYSTFMNPVVLPPGRAKLSTKPAPTGSVTIANTIGTVRVACCIGPTVGPPAAKMTSGRERDQFRRVFANAFGIARGPAGVDPHVAANGPAQLLQSLHERRERACPSGSSAASVMSTPMRRIRSPCCARAASGHAAAPPSSVMNSRRSLPSPSHVSDPKEDSTPLHRRDAALRIMQIPARIAWVSRVGVGRNRASLHVRSTTNTDRKFKALASVAMCHKRL